jgi:hypothetical protein
VPEGLLGGLDLLEIDAEGVGSAERVVQAAKLGGTFEQRADISQPDPAIGERTHPTCGKDLEHLATPHLGHSTAALAGGCGECYEQPVGVQFPVQRTSEFRGREPHAVLGMAYGRLAPRSSLGQGVQTQPGGLTQGLQGFGKRGSSESRHPYEEATPRP